MKQLHTFDEVFDSQKVFRCLLEAMANPGRRCVIREQSQKLFGENPELLAAAMTLLDASVSFCALQNPVLSEQIVLLTHAKEESPEQADYLFLSSVEQLSEIIACAKDGTLENPHSSATLVIKVPEGQEEKNIQISGPGVDGQLQISVPNVIYEAVRCRDLQQYEYPRGIDFIFLLPGDELLCLPRLVKMEVC